MDEIARLEGFRAHLKKALEVRKMSQGAVEKAAGLPDSYLSKVDAVEDPYPALSAAVARAALCRTEIVRADIGPIDQGAHRP